MFGLGKMLKPRVPKRWKETYEQGWQHKAQEIGIVDNGAAIKTGAYQGKPLSQVYDWETGGWVDNPNAVFCYMHGEDADDPFDIPETYDIKWISRKEMDAYITRKE